MFTFSELYILNYILSSLDKPLEGTQLSYPVPHCSIKRLQLSDHLLSPYYSIPTRSYTSKSVTSSWLATELAIHNLLSCVYISSNTIYYKLNNQSFNLVLPTYNHDPIYTSLVAAHCIRWGYWVYEEVGKGLYVIDNLATEYFTNSISCDCDYFRKYKQCPHTYLASTYLSNRSSFDFLTIRDD